MDPGSQYFPLTKLRGGPSPPEITEQKCVRPSCDAVSPKNVLELVVGDSEEALCGSSAMNIWAAFMAGRSGG